MNKWQRLQNSWVFKFQERQKLCLAEKETFKEDLKLSTKSETRQQTVQLSKILKKKTGNLLKKIKKAIVTTNVWNVFMPQEQGKMIERSIVVNDLLFNSLNI